METVVCTKIKRLSGEELCEDDRAKRLGEINGNSRCAEWSSFLTDVACGLLREKEKGLLVDVIVWEQYWVEASGKKETYDGKRFSRTLKRNRKNRLDCRWDLAW